MKRFTILIIAIVCGANLFAQTKEREVRRFEVEPHIGIASTSFLTMGIEYRYNFNQRPWDVGLNSALDFNGGRIIAVGDYNFARNKNCSFFVGAGAGWANTTIMNIDEAIEQYGDSCCASSQDCLCFSPRIGLELFRHLRLTATVNTYNFKEAEFILSLGVAIGGGRKQKINPVNHLFL